MVNFDFLLQGIFSGFSTGIGVGIANWILIKRLEALEKQIRNKIGNKVEVRNAEPTADDKQKEWQQ